jgi:hypothetical protein
MKLMQLRILESPPLKNYFLNFLLLKKDTNPPTEVQTNTCTVHMLQTAASCSRWFTALGFFYPEDGGDTNL